MKRVLEVALSNIQDIKPTKSVFCILYKRFARKMSPNLVIPSQAGSLQY